VRPGGAANDRWKSGIRNRFARRASIDLHTRGEAAKDRPSKIYVGNRAEVGDRKIKYFVCWRMLAKARTLKNALESRSTTP
jgi:hypothetical protein